MNEPTNLLPDELPLFCLSGCILLPRVRLPLNMFEQRYIDMVNYALGHGRLFGVVQPIEDKGMQKQPALYKIGCAGRIISFSETEDGRFLINLLGVSRFEIKNEVQALGPFRRAAVDWTGFQADLIEPKKTDFERARLTSLLRNYFALYGINPDWSVIQSSSDEELITSLCMSCPFEASEKQALLEAPSFLARTQTLIALLEMACLRQDEGDKARH